MNESQHKISSAWGPNPTPLSSPDVAVPVGGGVAFCGGVGGLFQVREHVFTYLGAVLQVHQHLKPGQDWAL